MERALQPLGRAAVPALLGAAMLPLGLGLALGLGWGAWPLLVELGLVGAGLGALLGAGVTRLRRRATPSVALALPLLAAAAGVTSNALAPSGPAVILIVVDCLRADRLDDDRLPRMSALAAESYTFTEAIAQSSWTRSSVPSLLSGLMPTQHRLYRIRPRPDRLPDEVRLLSQDLQASGYLTAGFIEQAQLDPAFGFDRGFDRYGASDGFARKLTQRFLLWNQLTRRLPRFAHLHLLDAHGPYTTGRRLRAPDLPPSDLPTQPAGAWRKTTKDIRRGRIEPSADDWARFSGLYDGELRMLDRRLGETLDRLEADGTLDAAWLVFTADHGEAFGEHGRGEHMGPPYEEVLRVPLFIRPPGGLPAARVIEAPVQHVDVLPTLLGALSLPARPGLAGRDLRPLFSGGAVPPVPLIAEEWAAKKHRVSLRWGDWKLIFQGDEAQLYDLSRDPREQVDLAAEAPERRAALESMLATWFEAAASGQALADVDWEAAAAAGRRWRGAEARSIDAEVSPDILEQLEAMGYVE